MTGALLSPQAAVFLWVPFGSFAQNPRWRHLLVLAVSSRAM